MSVTLVRHLHFCFSDSAGMFNANEIGYDEQRDSVLLLTRNAQGRVSLSREFGATRLPSRSLQCRRFNSKRGGWSSSPSQIRTTSHHLTCHLNNHQVDLQSKSSPLHDRNAGHAAQRILDPDLDLNLDLDAQVDLSVSLSATVQGDLEI